MLQPSRKEFHLDDQSASTSRTQVLLLISDPLLEGIYRNRLRSRDFCTIWCEKDENWRDALKRFMYDIIVVDYSLFEQEPIDHLVEIMRLTPTSEIIVLSGNEDVRLAISSYQMGIADYFLKPTNPETLLWAIEKLARRRQLKSSNEVLAADLMVFSVAHHINISESDTKMRDLAMKHLIGLTKAAGGLWVWPSPGTPESSAPLRWQAFGTIDEVAQKALSAFRAREADNFEGSFDSRLTSSPSEWFREGFVWIPLRAKWMGGILLFDCQELAEANVLARVEFVIRNLEISLENYRRFGEAKQLTYIDDLTGLYNSRYLEIAASAAIDYSKKTQSGVVVLFVDVDHFKKVNDGHGHLVGSQILVEMANQLKRSLRKSDQLFRYGGDEFIALLYDLSLKEGIAVAENIRAEVARRKFKIGSAELNVTLSIGVARFPDHGQDKKMVLKMADEAMYGGKKSGRNTVFEAPKPEAHPSRPEARRR